MLKLKIKFPPMDFKLGDILKLKGTKAFPFEVVLKVCKAPYSSRQAEGGKLLKLCPLNSTLKTRALVSTLNNFERYKTYELQTFNEDSVAVISVEVIKNAKD